MSGLLGVYALLVGADVASPYASAEEYEAALARAAEVIARADYVIAGIGSGMSSACGYDHYHSIPAFAEGGRLARFRRAHGFDTLMDGFYHLYATNEERWGFMAAYIDLMESAPVGRAYRQLAALLAGREYFVLTTNVDGQVRRAFPEERTWLFQGDLSLLQCAQPCCDEVWPALPRARRILEAMGPEGVAAPSELLPRCPHCGWLMVPWVRDATFLEGSLWRGQRGRYEAFTSRALASGGRVVFLELGVGGMTPAVIELPFLDMTARNGNAFYLRINKGKVGEPAQLGERSLTVCADIARVMDDISARWGGEGRNRS